MNIVAIEVLKNMNKTKKNVISAILVLFVLMMTAASVNAEETDEGIIPRTDESLVDDSVSNDLTDDLVISPNPEPILIEPGTDLIYEAVGETDNLIISDKTDEHSVISTMAIPAFIIIAVIVGISISIVLIKRK